MTINLIYIVLKTYTKVDKKLDSRGHTILELSQQRFFKNKNESDETLNTLWSIPITIVTKSSFPKVLKDILMFDKFCCVDLGRLDEMETIFLNSDNLGFYRVKYSKEMLEKLLSEYENDSKPFDTSLDRFGFVSDIFALVGF